MYRTYVQDTYRTRTNVRTHTERHTHAEVHTHTEMLCTANDYESDYSLMVCFPRARCSHSIRGCSPYLSIQLPAYSACMQSQRISSIYCMPVGYPRATSSNEPLRLSAAPTQLDAKCAVTQSPSYPAPRAASPASPASCIACIALALILLDGRPGHSVPHTAALPARNRRNPSWVLMSHGSHGRRRTVTVTMKRSEICRWYVIPHIYYCIISFVTHNSYCMPTYNMYLIYSIHIYTNCTIYWYTAYSKYLSKLYVSSYSSIFKPFFGVQMSGWPLEQMYICL
jgi:hypothetical protein